MLAYFSTVVQIRAPQIQDGEWPPSWKLDKSQYLKDRLTVFDET